MGDRAELEKLRRLQQLEAKAVKHIGGRQQNVDQMGGWEKFGHAMGAEGELIGRKIGNIGDKVGRAVLGIEGGPDPNASYSTETIRRREAEMAPLRDTGPGMAGELLMDASATAPLAAVGGGMQALAGARYTPRVLGAVLRARPAQAAVEGSMSGALLADPEKRAAGAGYGAAGGTIGERIGSVLGRTIQGLVKRSPAAQNIDRIADLYETQVDMPLAQAASDEGIISPFAKFLYGKVLPNLPGAEGALKRQAARSGAQFREIALKEASPGGMGSQQPGYAGGLPMTTKRTPGAGQDVRVTMENIQDAFEREYGDTIKAYAFNQPKGADLAKYLKQKFPGIDDATVNGVSVTTDALIDQFSKAGQIDGTGIIRAKAALAKLGTKADDEVASAAFVEAQEFLDNVVSAELKIGNKAQNIKDLERYLSLREPWNNFLRVQRAAARTKSPTGEFTPQELTRAVKSMSGDRELARGGAPMQELASVGEQTVGQTLHQPSFLERAVTLGSLGSLGAFTGGVPGLALTWAGGRTAASPFVQNTLMGQLDSQKAIAKLLREHPNQARLYGAMLRNTLAGDTAEENTDASQ